MKRITAALVFLIVVSASTSALCEVSRVAVMPFKNNGQAQLNSLAAGLSAMFTTNLTKAKDVEIVDPQRVTAALVRTRLAGGAPSAEDAIKAAAALEADYLLTGEFVSFGSRFRIDLRLYDVKAGTLKFADKAQAKEDAFFDAVDELSDKVVLFITGSMPAVGGSLQVISEPSGADVLLDGEPAGTTPVTRSNIPTGQHRVEVQLEGYQPFSQTVTVNEKEAAKVDAKLVRLFGGIRLWWKDVPTSDINISGETIPMRIFDNTYSNYPVYCKNIPAGSYSISVRLPSKEESSWESKRTWKTHMSEIDVEPGQVTDIFINNDMFSPSLVISTCGSCAADWDFTSKITWYESTR